jgi:hypothetical protein
MMPFDVAGFKEAETKSKISISDAAALLRDRSQWPEGFVWDYRHIYGCAIGLITRKYGCHAGNLQEMLGITYTHYHNAFIAAAIIHKRSSMIRVTPEDVAIILEQPNYRAPTFLQRIIGYFK